jgi:hypothetical protein
MEATRSNVVLAVTLAALIAAAGFGLLTARFAVAFVAIVTLAAAMVPLLLPSLVKVHVPAGFSAAVALFLTSTLFLGEVGDFYNRFWWWDILMHAGSAVGLGLVGVIVMLILVEAERLTAAAVTVSVFAFCFAVSIGVIWEIFEFTVDQILGTNMQKSGLVDTMWDLIVDCLGGAVGAASGYAYLKNQEAGGLASIIREFVGRNRQLFRK